MSAERVARALRVRRLAEEDADRQREINARLQATSAALMALNLDLFDALARIAGGAPDPASVAQTALDGPPTSKETTP